MAIANPKSGLPLISVILPTLNEEKLISKTLSQFTPELKSAFGIEVVISDGGSIDKTLELCNDSADQVIENTEGVKQTISMGRNIGAMNAEGMFLYFFNADTRINNPIKFFTETLESFKNKKILAATCRIKVFPEEQKLSDKLFHGTYNKYVRLLNFIGMGMGRGECHLVRREVFIKLKGYNETLAAGEDYDLFKRIRKEGKIKFFNNLTVYESPRRYRKYGYFSVFADWTKNSLSVFFKNKSSSKEWEAVR